MFEGSAVGNALANALGDSTAAEWETSSEDTRLSRSQGPPLPSTMAKNRPSDNLTAGRQSQSNQVSTSGMDEPSAPNMGSGTGDRKGQVLFQRPPTADQPEAFDRAASADIGRDMTGAAAAVKADKGRLDRVIRHIQDQARGPDRNLPRNLQVAEVEDPREVNALLRFMAPPGTWARKYPRIHKVWRKAVKAEIDQSRYIKRMQREYDDLTRGLSKAEVVGERRQPADPAVRHGRRGDRRRQQGGRRHRPARPGARSGGGRRDLERVSRERSARSSASSWPRASRHRTARP